MPQEAWSDKDERQYEHVKESEKERGKSEDRDHPLIDAEAADGAASEEPATAE